MQAAQIDSGTHAYRICRLRRGHPPQFVLLICRRLTAAEGLCSVLTAHESDWRAVSYRENKVAGPVDGRRSARDGCTACHSISSRCAS
jgi:hypothetical protein